MARLILGHTTDSSIKIWVRGSERWPAAFIELLDGAGSSVASKKLLTPAEEFYTAVAEFKGLNADSPYRVKVAFGKTLADAPEARVRDAYTEGTFRTFPASGKPAPLRFLLGSCNLHSLGLLERPDRAWLEISALAKAHEARFMMHCGDQIYADIPLPPSVDVQHFRDKYLDAWDDCVPARKVLTELPHYMVLDDHELINDYDRGDPKNNPQLANMGMKAYWEFQHSHNPDSRHDEYHYHYEFNHGRVRFFVMDTRFNRDSELGEMIDVVQELDLLRWLTRYRDDLKFIVTSVPFVGIPRRSVEDKWSGSRFEKQRARILKHLLDKGIGRVVFLTGDMHNAYHATLDVSQGNKTLQLNELMSSPINQVTPHVRLQDAYRVDDAAVQKFEGLTTQARITPESFYGKHSNVMLIEVEEGDGVADVAYRIFRTTASENGPTGSFKA
ncbi:phosphodiesterase/alkaline phosphatase D-like protein [Pseudomonas alcaligenes]|nr:phosphodiesterase/alkaline phosphatase D-like protein [Pseudomonas alcaligenes]